MYKGLGEKMETSVACRAVESRRESQRPPYLSSTFTLTTRVPVYQTGSRYDKFDENSTLLVCMALYEYKYSLILSIEDTSTVYELK